MILNKDRENILLNIRYNFPYYASRFLWIVDKQRNLIPFRLNSTQQIIDKRIEEEQVQKGLPIRAFVLKPRQIGCSTYGQGRLFQAETTIRYTEAMTVAHDTDTALAIHNISERFLRHFDKNTHKGFKPRVKYRSKRSGIGFSADGDGMGSRAIVETAGNVNIGRAFTLTHLQLSEAARYTDAKNVVLSLTNAIPDPDVNPNTMILVESTACGMDEFFYQGYKAAERGDTEYLAIFISWADDPTYETDVPPDFKLDSEEKKLQKEYELSLRKLAWRRWCIKNKCDGDVELFNQEYPLNADEAFLYSGEAAFSGEILRWYMKNAVMAGIKGHLEDGKFIEGKRGTLEIFKLPEGGHRYVIGGDAAEGLEKGDWSVGEVFDIETLEQVAELRGKIPPDLFGVELSKLGYFYNHAFIGVEAKQYGWATLNELTNLKYRKLYYRKTWDERKRKKTKKLGWYTTEKTRPIMIDTFRKFIRTKEIGIRSKVVISECTTFVNNNGKLQASSGCHDDTVIASAIAMMIRGYNPIWAEDRPVEIDNSDAWLDDITAY